VMVNVGDNEAAAIEAAKLLSTKVADNLDAFVPN